MDNKLRAADRELYLTALSYMERNRPDNVSWKTVEGKEQFTVTLRWLNLRGLLSPQEISDGIELSYGQAIRWFQPFGAPGHSSPIDVFKARAVWDWVITYLEENYDAQFGQTV